jgi:vacuolar-type H+-ATPase subunit C/Vma6
LNPEAFDVYNFKRLIRAIKYDERKDTSFDFLTIGEDDID